MKHRLALLISLTGVTIMASSTILVSAAEAQRRGGGGGGGRGGGGGGGGVSRGGGGGGGSWGAQASRPSNGPSMRGGSRSSVNQNVNRGNVNTGNVNRGNVNTGNVNRGNINTGNINTGDINVDVDRNYGWGGGYDYRPGYGAAVVAGAAVGAAVVGSYYSALPPGCVTVYRAQLVLLSVRKRLVSAGLFGLDRPVCGGECPLSTEAAMILLLATLLPQDPVWVGKI